MKQGWIGSAYDSPTPSSAQTAEESGGWVATCKSVIQDCVKLKKLKINISKKNREESIEPKFTHTLTHLHIIKNITIKAGSNSVEMFYKLGLPS